MNEQYIFLAPEAIFPVVNDENGQPLSNKPATGFKIAGTLQGEGKMVGMPVLFMRTSGCNLRCMWHLPDGQISLCDTPFASFNTRHESRKTLQWTKGMILNNLGKLNHLVISGGEPFIQPDALVSLIAALKAERKLKVSIETNGTIFHQELVNSVDFFSISPKLINSLPTETKLITSKVPIPFTIEHAANTRRNIVAIQEMIDHCKAEDGKDFQLKFVIQNHDELDEIEQTFLAELTGWQPDDIVLMPLGSTPEELRQTRMITLEAAVERGWRFSPRLQINYFNGVAGV